MDGANKMADKFHVAMAFGFVEKHKSAHRFSTKQQKFRFF